MKNLIFKPRYSLIQAAMVFSGTIAILSGEWFMAFAIALAYAIIQRAEVLVEEEKAK